MPTDQHEIDHAIHSLQVLSDNGSEALKFLVNYLKANVDDIKEIYQDT